MASENRLVQAFKEPANMVGIATALSASAATLSVVPLLAGLVAEAAYLLFVPDSKWYHDKQKAREAVKEQARKDALRGEVLPMLRPEMEARFLRLEKMRSDIAGQTVEGESWFRDLVAKLDYLLEKFLLFARSEVQFRNYLRSVQEEVRGVARPVPPPRVSERVPVHDKRGNRRGPQKSDQPAPEVDRAPHDPSNRWIEEAIRQVSEHYTSEIASLQAATEAEQDPNTRAVLEKRTDVLQRRQEHVGKIGKILTNLNHQLELLEDSFGLINDQIRARSPEQILADVDEMVWQTDTMTQVLEEIAPYEQLVARLG
jgi:hypothetical protein